MTRGLGSTSCGRDVAYRQCGKPAVLALVPTGHTFEELFDNSIWMPERCARCAIKGADIWSHDAGLPGLMSYVARLRTLDGEPVTLEQLAAMAELP